MTDFLKQSLWICPICGVGITWPRYPKLHTCSSDQLYRGIRKLQVNNKNLRTTITAYQKIVTDQETQLVDLQVETYLRVSDFSGGQKEKGLLKERIETLEELLECSYKTSDDSEEERSSENES